MTKTIYTVTEVSRMTGLGQEEITLWIEKEWITPPEPSRFDTEDVARLHLIKDMIYDLGANDDAIPIILHLVDQLCLTKDELRKLKKAQL